MNRELWTPTYLRKSYKMKARGGEKKGKLYVRKDGKQGVKLSSNKFFSNLRVGFPMYHSGEESICQCRTWLGLG